MQDFSRIAAPMTRLTQKNVRFVWSDACENSFQLLKEKLTTAPVLTLPMEKINSLFIVMPPEWD